ncbi:pentatricopeptide repeat-containing protein At4g32450, mitochondrial-like [Castanea sativa]|uniref:pentatricopeptide repeat-containing protein At4g32450, mitochondrial-like n=1 Tax=Castanea sativa TaxID=21020 RepID=UPI003F652A74
MSTKRAAILTNTALSKVCSSLNSSNSRKTLTFLKNLSTAAQRLDFENTDGSQCQVDDSLEYQQKHSESQNPADFHHKSNPNEGYRESNTNDFVSYPVGQNGSFSGFNEQNEFYQNSSGVYRESFRSTYQNNPAGQNGNFRGNCGQNVGQLQQNLTGIHANNLTSLEQNSSGFWESTRNGFQNHSVQQNGNFGGNYGYNNGEFLQNHHVYGGNGRIQNSCGSSHKGASEVRQNPYGFDSQGLSESQGSLNGNYRQICGQAQQAPDDHNLGNVGMFQHSRSSGQHQQNQHVVQYPPNLNAFKSMTEGSKLSNNPKHEGKFLETPESHQYLGTLEELDGFCNEGKVKEAVEVLGLLVKQCHPVDLARYLQLMWECGEAQSLQEAKSVHEHIIRSLSPLEVSTYNRIIEMYGKCGSMDDAFMVFNAMPTRNLTSWDTMMTWLAKNGLGEDAIDLFTQFKKKGMKPDGQMFIGVLSACSVLGDIDEGLLHFESMIKDYGIVPSMDHYVKVIDMLGNTGYLDEAFEFIEKMPLEPSVNIWETLMDLCRVHGHMELGDRCAGLVEQLDPSRMNEQSKAGLLPVKPSDLAKQKEKKKLVSQSLLEVRSRVHEYRAGDRSHPNTDKLYAELRHLREQMKEAGYIPETRFVLHDIDHESKEEALLAHSERLAIADGLLNSPVRSPIRIIKNLRVCGDCHTALKVISKIVGRELIIRDAKRFHHFKDGLCSCQDYW